MQIGVDFTRKPGGPLLYTLSCFARYLNYFNVWVQFEYPFFQGFHVEIGNTQIIYFVYDKDIAYTEYERIFERLVITFRNTQDHGFLMGTRVKFRRTDKVSDVLDNDKIKILQVHFIESHFYHGGVQMAEPSRF
jgi:hypothetical protein